MCARRSLVAALTQGGDSACDSQTCLPAARLSCKTLQRAVDDGLQSLRLNVRIRGPQGPAPCLSRFSSVHSLTLSIDAEWRRKQTSGSPHHAELFPEEPPSCDLQLGWSPGVHPPSLLLAPLKGQPAESLRRLQRLTLVGVFTAFEALCTQLCAVFNAAPPAAARASSTNGHNGGGLEMQPGAVAAAAANSSDRSAPDGGFAADGSGLSDDSSSAAAAGSGGAGASSGDGGGGSCSLLVHLHMGQLGTSYKLRTLHDTRAGHKALAALQLAELTIQKEQLPGLEAHKVGTTWCTCCFAAAPDSVPLCAPCNAVHVRGLTATTAPHTLRWFLGVAALYPCIFAGLPQNLRRLQVYGIGGLRHAAAAAESLRLVPLRHVGFHYQDTHVGCAREEFREATERLLESLPDTITSLCTTHTYKATLRFGQDASGQVGRWTSL